MVKRGLEWLDDRLIKLINIRMKSDLLDMVMIRLTHLGGAFSIIFFVFTLLYFGNKRGKSIGIQAAITLAISQIITYGIKIALGRERPYNILRGLNTFNIILKDSSFPSGHTSASFAIATTIAFNMPKLAIVAYGLALAIGISRIYLGVHYPTDVIAGMILGIGVAVTAQVHIIDYVLEFVGRFSD